MIDESDGPLSEDDVAAARRLLGRPIPATTAVLDQDARETLYRVLATPSVVAPPFTKLGHKRRWAISISVAAVAAALVAIVPVHAMSAHRAASPSERRTAGLHHIRLVDFQTTADGEIIARITDPLAAASQLDAAFREYGLDISVSTVPVSPSLVGTIIEESVPNGVDLQSLWGQSGGCLGGDVENACPIGLVIPAGFHGPASVYVGRAAQPGESYESTGNVFSSGEVLHCSGLLGATPATALADATAMGLKVQWNFLEPQAGDNQSPDDTTMPTSGFIVGGSALSSSTVSLTVSPTYPPPGDEMEDFSSYVAAANAGC